MGRYLGPVTLVNSEICHGLVRAAPEYLANAKTDPIQPRGIRSSRMRAQVDQPVTLPVPHGRVPKRTSAFKLARSRFGGRVDLEHFGRDRQSSRVPEQPINAMGRLAMIGCGHRRKGAARPPNRRSES